MSLNNNLNKILIIDFGSQFTQLIARRIRELGIYSEIISHKKINNLNEIKMKEIVSLRFSNASIQKELEKSRGEKEDAIINLNPNHISAYTLTLEKGTDL